MRLPSSIGDLGLLLDGDARICDGDVLVADDARVIALEVVADDVLVAYPDSIAQAVEIAHALGNRHIPVIREGDAIVVGYAAPLEGIARTHAAACASSASPACWNGRSCTPTPRTCTA